MLSALYTGQVYHKRLRPVEHALRYRVFTLLLSLDELDTLCDKHWLFSRNKWNLLSFYDKDFGEGEDKTLQSYVHRKLADAGIKGVADKILLSCYPRVLGHAFNPISLFYCLDSNGNAIAVLHEVHNTFGERHTYVLPVNQIDNDQTIHQASEKLLFVSPFAHMNMNYEFQLNVPGKKLWLVIKANDEKGHLITASYSAQRHEITSTTLMKQVLAMPVLGLKVVVGIHWEAFRLWIKRVPWFSHEPKAFASANKQKES